MQNFGELNRHYHARLARDLAERMGESAPATTNFASGAEKDAEGWVISLEAELSRHGGKWWAKGSGRGDDIEAAYAELLKACSDA